MSISLRIPLCSCATGSLLALSVACSPPPAEPPRTDAVAAYGYGPDPDGGAKYQPDVVLIGEGPEAIRSESADGLTWVIAGNADGARELAVDKVVFATSRAVGRIVSLERRGGDLALTLAPVNLTEIVREADIRAEFRIDPDKVSFRQVPDLLHVGDQQPAFLRDDGFLRLSLPVAAEPAHDGWMLATEALYLHGGAEPMLMPVVDSAGTLQGGVKTSVLGFDVSLSMRGEAGSEAIGLGLSRTLGPSRASLDFKLITRGLGIRTNLPIRGGKLDSSATFVVDGLEALNIDLKAGTADGTLDNREIRLEVPLEMYVDIPPSPETAGLPLVMVLKVKFLLKTAFSARNSVLGASGRYGLAGSLGYAEGKLVTPTFSVIEPMMRTLDGISVGANAIVFATDLRFQVGVGTRVTLAGPYGKVTTAIGATLGSSVGLIRCSGVSVKIDTAAGVGIQFSSELGGVLQRILGKKLSTSQDLAEHSSTLVDRTSIHPDVPLCAG